MVEGLMRLIESNRTADGPRSQRTVGWVLA